MPTPYRHNRKPKRSKRQGLFVGYWFDTFGRRQQRVRRPELAEAYRLWAKHKDVRQGALEEAVSVGSEIGVRAHVSGPSSAPASSNARPTFSDEVGL